MKYEYKWTHSQTKSESIYILGKEGWRVVPGIMRVHADFGECIMLLMERELNVTT